MPTIERIDGYADELTAIRRDLHAHPEIGFEEVRTSGIVAEKLKGWGIEVHRGLGGTGVIYDPESARTAHAAGTSATVPLSLGGKSGISGDAPYKETFVVEKLSDGKFVAPGPYYGGRDMDMGPSACLRIGDVRVVVASYKAQLADQAMYRYVGIEPTEQKILVNKSSVHFRADFEPIAEKLLLCAAPGANDSVGTATLSSAASFS